jgi:hypothetical protein
MDEGEVLAGVERILRSNNKEVRQSLCTIVGAFNDRLDKEELLDMLTEALTPG